MGSDASHYALCNKIWSTSVYLSPPNLFVTINLADWDDPVAQVFCGVPLDLDHFIPLERPSKRERMENLARDSYAGAKYHHFILNAIIRCLYQLDIGSQKAQSGMGILGEIEAMVVVWESQNHQSLHVHWLA